MRVRFWGTRGSIAAPGRETVQYGGNTTCVEVIPALGSSIVIDAGTGIRVLGQALPEEGQGREIHLLMTHIHWDHVLGFPFFRPISDPGWKISVDGFAYAMKGIKAVFASNMGDGFFPVRFQDLKARIDFSDNLSKGATEIEGIGVDAIPLHHPQGGLGFRFREGGKTMVFLTDNELRGDAWKDRALADYATFCRDADLLIHDAQFTPQEMAGRKGWGHSDFETVLELALRAGVRRLLLFHHDPSRTDGEIGAIERRCREILVGKGSPLSVEAAREGVDTEV